MLVEELARSLGNILTGGPQRGLHAELALNARWNSTLAPLSRCACGWSAPRPPFSPRARRRCHILPGPRSDTAN